MTGGAPSILAFLFRPIPVKERQFRASRRPHRSGVRFPSYSGKGTPVPFVAGLEGKAGAAL